MRPRWTTLLPPEHGSWAFLILPLAVGLLRRPSLAGGLLALAVVCAFLIRIPLQRLHGLRRHPDAMVWARTLRPLGILAALAAMLAGASHSVVALGIAGGLLAAMSVPGIWVVRRSVAWELGAAGLFSLQAPMILRLGGASIREAGLVWVFLALFSLPPIFYLRQRLDSKGDLSRIWSSMAIHAAALLLAFCAFWAKLAPLAFLIWASMLAARSLWGISRSWHAGRGRRLGMTEAFVGCVHLGLLVGGGWL
jgi:hypothetical protein